MKSMRYLSILAILLLLCTCLVAGAGAAAPSSADGGIEFDSDSHHTSALIEIEENGSIDKLQIGHVIEVQNASFNGIAIYDAAYGKKIGVKKDGERGIIIGGSDIADSEGVSDTWWEIEWSDGLIGWSIQSFAVDALAASLPDVRTMSAVTSITPSSATIWGWIANDGGSPIIERRFDWGQYTPLTQVIWSDSITVSGNYFYGTLRGLSPNTRYYFRAWAKNSAGWSYGEILSFTTEPATTTLSFTDLTPSTITTSDSTHDVTLSATGNNFNNVNQVKFEWSGSDSGIQTWNRGDNNWNSKVTIDSDTSMTMRPRVLSDAGGTQTQQWTWTVTLRDTSGVTKSRTFTVYYVPPKGRISITSNPTSASIYLDGSYQGSSPLTISSVSAGSHNVKLTKSGYRDWTSSVSVVAGQTTSINAQMSVVQPTTGSISITSTPTSANVYLDGSYQGSSPMTITSVSTGSHSIKLTKSGYQDWTTSVSVVAGQTTSINAQMTPIINPENILASVDIDLLNYLDTLIDPINSEYFNPNWKVSKDQYKMMLAALIWGEGNKAGYSAHSCSVPLDSLDHPDLYNKFWFSSGIGPLQIDRGGISTDSWSNWPTIKKLDYKEALKSALNMHKHRCTSVNSIEDVRLNCRAIWYAYYKSTEQPSGKPLGRWEYTWKESTGTTWDSVSNNNKDLNTGITWVEMKNALSYNAQYGPGDIKWEKSNEVIQDIGDHIWTIKSEDNVYTDENIKITIEDEKLNTYKITAKSLSGGIEYSMPYYYTNYHPQHVEIWAYYNPDDLNHHLKSIFIRDYSTGYFPEGRNGNNAGITLNHKVVEATLAETKPPQVNAFDVTPRSGSSSTQFTISYTISDTGGSGLKQVELWTATDTNGDGEPDWPSTPPQDPRLLSGGNGPISGSFYNTPPSSITGSYWYGLHVVDNAGNWNDERNSKSDGFPGVYGPIKVTITEPDTTPPTISITSPSNNQNFNTDTITVTGTAADNVGLTKVEVKVGSGSWMTASGTNSWNRSVNLAPGSNIITARAYDTSDNTKETSVTVTYTRVEEPTVDDPEWTGDFNDDPVQILLARAIFGEAIGEPNEGKLAVGWVIRNRVDNPRWWGNDYHSVILKDKQFSCFNSDDPNYVIIQNPLIHDETTWRKSYEIAGTVISSNKNGDITMNSDHFYSISITPPSWADEQKFVKQIGSHKFYRLELNAPESGGNPQLHTDPATEITETTTILHGHLQDGVPGETYDVCFRYEGGGVGKTKVGHTTVTATSANYEYTLTNLQPGTTYYYRAVHQDSQGVGDNPIDAADIKTFTTLGDQPSGGRYRVDWENAASNGWFNLMGENTQLWTHPNYNFDSQFYRTNHNTRHAGVDFVSETGEDVTGWEVHAISDGEVVQFFGKNTQDECVIIQHDSQDGSFFAVYGHINTANRGLEEGSLVAKGQVIGTVRETMYNPDHLHFGINTNDNVADFMKDGNGWGRTRTDTDPRDIGWHDPIPYLENTRLTELTVLSGVYRNGLWILKDGTRINYGTSTDIPVVVDGKIGVYRNGLWIIKGVEERVWWGTPTDVPVVVDGTIGVYRNGLWILKDGTREQFGTPTDIPVVVDDKIGVYRNGLWILKDGTRTHYGTPTDIPVVVDGKIGVYRNGLWIIKDGVREQFGLPTDIPVFGAIV